MPTAKSTMSEHWFVRVDGELEVLRPKVLQFAQRLDVKALLGVAHMGKTKENPHAHMCIHMSKAVQKQTFQIAIKTHFSVVDRGYAVDIWDGNYLAGAVTYVFHEDDAPILCHKGWYDEEIATLVAKGKLIADAVDDQKQKASTRLVDKATQHFSAGSPTKSHILDYMLNEVKSGRNYYPGQFKLKSFVEEVEIKLCPPNQFHSLVNSIYNNLWR